MSAMTISREMLPAAGTPPDDVQYVTLGIDREVFAVPVALVREILDPRPLCRMPEAPPHLAGLIDVRGRGVPVIDLRVKLGRPALARTDATRILVLDVALSGRRLELALIADRVFEVTALDRHSVTPPPDIGTDWRCDYVRGIGRRGEDFVIILDLAYLLGSDAVALLPPDPLIPGPPILESPVPVHATHTEPGTPQEALPCA
jgi:purine-binding chemotaxis protein CheW